MFHSSSCSLRHNRNHLEQAPSRVTQAQKKVLENKMTLESSFNLIRKIQAGDFRAPSISFLQKRDPRKSQSKIPKRDHKWTTPHDEAPTDCGSSCLSREDSTIIQSTLVQSSKVTKRCKHVLKVFKTFEELCISGRLLCPNQLVELGDLSRRMLQVCELDSSGLLRFQQADSISLAILLLCVSQLGISKKILIKEANKIYGKGTVKLSLIKRSRCFKTILDLAVTSKLICCKV